MITQCYYSILIKMEGFHNGLKSSKVDKCVYFSKEYNRWSNLSCISTYLYQALSFLCVSPVLPVIQYLCQSILCHFVLSSPGHRTPPARSGHRCVADNTNLYVFGGYNPDYDESGGSENEDYPLFRELWRYHFATGCWQQIRTEGYMPTELASMSGEMLYITF